jgi:hypothetical protein
VKKKPIFQKGEFKLSITMTGYQVDELEACAEKNPDIAREILRGCVGDNVTYTEGFLTKYPHVAKILRELIKEEKMGSETNWICDWCGVRVENMDRYPKDWALLDTGRATARRGRGQHDEVPLFPKEMSVEKTDEHPAHYESEICGECFQAILDALKNTREARIAKRAIKPDHRTRRG